MFGKFIAYAVPIALISLAFGILALAVAPGEPTDITFLAALLFGFAFGCCAIYLAMSAAAPQFGADPAQRTTPLVGRIVAGGAGLLICLPGIVGVALSPFGNPSIGMAVGMAQIKPGGGGWALPLLVAILIPVTMMVVGTRRAGRLPGAA